MISPARGTLLIVNPFKDPNFNEPVIPAKTQPTKCPGPARHPVRKS